MWDGWGVRAHCWVLRERAPEVFRVFVVFRPLGVSAAGLVVGVLACGAGLAAIPHRDPFEVVFSWGVVVVGGGVGWCPFVF